MAEEAGTCIEEYAYGEDDAGSLVHPFAGERSSMCPDRQYGVIVQCLEYFVATTIAELLYNAAEQSVDFEYLAVSVALGCEHAYVIREESTQMISVVLLTGSGECGELLAYGYVVGVIDDNLLHCEVTLAAYTEKPAESILVDVDVEYA